ncbi:MAG: DNA repair protein RadA [Lachnospiraceae bacterium]|nr:DNA repair protein RadA [Lachnospiraceae bacterium]
MAKKEKTVFVCQQCGYESAQWIGKCICGAWNSFVEEKVLPNIQEDPRRRATTAKAKPSALKTVGTAHYERIDTGIGELNRVLGGGLVKGSLVLISGEPGIGKSTIIIQTAANLAAQGKIVLYVSGEESEEQIKLRADRVCPNLSDNLLVLAETNMENVETICGELKADFLIVDSIQTMYSSQADSAPGSVSQVRVCGNQLMKLGKTRNMPIFIVAHVTKSGELAGPKTVEHLVDCVLNFSGERDQEIRVLRSFKNRFGTTSEIGAFRMEAAGLMELPDISATFLEGQDEQVEGSVTTAVYEGTRPVMFEIQALVSPANIGFARRTSVGIDNNRLNMILAVMEKKAGLQLVNQDVYVNVVGGIKPDGTSTDLAAALAIYSSLKRVTPARKTLAVGEIGLTGEIRNVQNAEKIAKEAARMGYKLVIMPKNNAEKLPKELGGARVVGVRNIIEAIKALSI